MVGSRGEWRPALLDPNIKKKRQLSDLGAGGAGGAGGGGGVAWRGVAAGSEPLKPYLA